MKRILEFLRSEDGPTAVEYAVMLALILMFCIGAIRLMGDAAADSLGSSANQMEDAFNGSGS